MLDAITRTRGALTAAHRLSVRTQIAVGGYRLAARAVALLLAAAALDLFFPLANILRGAFMGGLAAWTAATVGGLWRRSRAETVRLERAARLLEIRHPELENALINAVQFDQELARRPDAPGAPLMRREMARAEEEAARLPLDSLGDTQAIARAHRVLLALGLLIAVSLVLLPRVYRFELPRLFLFWGDYPPFTLTDFRITPHGAHIKVGGSITLNVTVGGLIPDSLTLVTGTGPAEHTTPLYAGDNGVYTQTLENLTTDTWYYVRANTGRSTRYRIAVDQAPAVKTVRLTLHPPAYTRRPPESIPLTEAGISGLNGTQVDVEVDATRPLEGGRLDLAYPDAPGEAVPLVPQRDHPEQAVGSFTVRRSGDFRLGLAAIDGLTTPDAAHGKVTLVRDEKPIVYMTSPGQNAVATPDMQVLLRAEAEDDIAVQRIEIHRIVNNMADSAQAFPVPPGRRRADANLRLDLKDLGARPGDVIQYYATAYDNDPGRPNLTDSERYWLWIVSAEDYRKIAARQRGLPQMAAQYRALTDALKALAEQQRSLADRMAEAHKQAALRPHAPEIRRQVQSLQKQQAELRRQAQDLAQEMRRLAAQKPQYDVEKGLQKRLADLAKRIGQAAAGPMRAAQSAPSTRDMVKNGEQAARQLEQANGQGQQTVEKALQALEKTAPVYDDINHLRQLARKQGELSMQARQQAQQVKQDSFQQSRLAELAAQQARVREALRQVQRDLQEHAGQAAQVAPSAAAQAQGIAQALDRMAVADRMAAAEDHFRSQDSLSGASAAEQARRDLESLFRQGKTVQQGAKQGLDRQLGQDSGNTLEQMSRGMGMGQEAGGQGVAQGQGAQPAPQPGSRPGQGAEESGGSQQRVLALSAQPKSGSSRKREDRAHFPAGERPGALGNADVEHLADPGRKPVAASDASSGRYPAEYRRLVKDYFKAVTTEK